MSVSINGTTGLVFNDGSTQPTAASGFGFKNRIINGDMRIDQRNAGASVTPADGQYVLDRWQNYLTQSSKFSVQRNAGAVTPPAGFTNYLGITSLSAYSVSASDIFATGQQIEGFNAADFAWGTANAQTVTMSFWVRSSLTGTFGGSLTNNAQNRFYAFSYTVSAANTWEYKTITIAGDTSGTWATDNSAGIRVRWGLGVGSNNSGTAGSWGGSSLWSATGAVSVVGTNGATFQATGVQLEKGSTATSFDYRPYGTELALCQRYFETFATSTNSSAPYQGVVGYFATNVQLRSTIPFRVTKRAAPTLTIPTTNVNINYAGGSIGATSPSSDYVSLDCGGFQISLASGSSTAGYSGTINFFTGNPVLISSEL